MKKTVHETPPSDSAARTRARTDAAREEAQRHALRADDTNAFVSDPSKHESRVRDELAEELGEGFITAATSGQETGQDHLDEVLDEEVGGPFLETSGEEQFATGTDGSNPHDAERAAFPTAVADKRQ